jgi:hypothetical protein
MKDFSKGKIYQVRSVSRPDLIYIGSTVSALSVRMGGHRLKTSKCKSKQIMDIGDAYIELLEAFPCENNEALLARENHHMRLVDCVNKRLAINDCPHGRDHNKCVECHGAGVCEHNKLRKQCKPCGGSQICEHNRNRSHCKPCGGSQVCEHNKKRITCTICSPVKCECCDKTSSRGNIGRHNNTKVHKLNSLRAIALAPE